LPSRDFYARRGDRSVTFFRRWTTKSAKIALFDCFRAATDGVGRHRAVAGPGGSARGVLRRNRVHFRWQIKAAWRVAGTGPS